MLHDASRPTDTGRVDDSDTAKNAPLPKPTARGLRAIQGEPFGITATDRVADAATVPDGKADGRTPGIGAPNQMIDTPVHNQGNQPDCLLQSARMAEHKQTGQDPGLAAYKEPAAQEGIYESGPNGGVDSLEGFTAIMNERPNIAAEFKSGAGPQDIKRPLDNRESVIACVNAHEFYKSLGYQTPRDGAGHAVVVTGADQTADGSWQFTVNDPNCESGSIPVDGSGFLRAWDAQGRQMITVKPKGDAR